MRKQVFCILSFFFLVLSHLSAQIKTRDSREDISINGIKFGYIYSIDQFKKALGEPDRIDTWDATDYGKGHELIYGNDLTVRFNDDARDLQPGIICFILKTDKYTLDIKGTKLKVGDSVEKVKTIKGYTKLEWRWDDYYVVLFNNHMTDESVMVQVKDGIITQINIEDRYY